jgi:hypothetical protein
MKITNWYRKLHSSTSKRRQRVLASLAAAGIVGSGSLAQADTSTTLTGVIPSVINDPVPVDHGSNAEVALAWSVDPKTWDQYPDWNGRGDVYQIDQRMTDITFAPSSPLIKMTIQNFFLDEWAGGGDTTSLWSVTGSVSGLLASGIWVDKNTANDPADAGGRTLVTANANGIAGETLTLAFDHSGSAGFISYLAMDNLTFSTMIIPEPATGVLSWAAVGGLGAMAMRRKRK